MRLSSPISCSLAALAVLALLFAGLPEARAQWAAGAGYQLRVGNPGQGVQLRLQRSFDGPKASVVFIRGSAAYFPEQTRRIAHDDYGRTTQSHSYDVALGGGVAGQHGRFRTYLGLSGGYERRLGKVEEGGFGCCLRRTRIDAGSVYIAPSAGMNVRTLGGVRPYVEYHYPVYLAEAVLSENIGRLAAGISVQF